LVLRGVIIAPCRVGSASEFFVISSFVIPSFVIPSFVIPSLIISSEE
jgi:hypothetical protein